MNKRFVTIEEIKERVQIFAKEKGKDPKEIRAFGIPRGGCAVAALFDPVDDPEFADIIVDDLVDSGSTRETWMNTHPTKEFFAPFDKTKEEEIQGKWLVFPWEEKETPIEDHVRRVIQSFGEDLNREGLKETPKRYLKFWREFLNPEPFNLTTFSSESVDQMIVQTNIPFYSVCEHHLAPFYGVGHIAYIPKDRILGLSKLARVLDFYARSLQNQERITEQVAREIQEATQGLGVAVVIEAEHLCMTMRGIKKPGTKTRSSVLRGKFRTDEAARNEFLNLLK